MSRKKGSWLGQELTYLLLAPFLVLLGVLGYGILFDKWFKEPILILQYSAIAYGVIMGLRFLGWAFRTLSR